MLFAAFLANTAATVLVPIRFRMGTELALDPAQALVSA
jgi:hypothetical protein